MTDGHVRVSDFMTPGAGDDAIAINAAIKAAQGKPVLLEAKTYYLDTPIELNWTTDASTASRPATKLIGAGKDVTVLVNRGTGPAVQHTVTVAQADVGLRMTNGELAHFTIRRPGNTPNAGGIRLFSFWLGHLHDLGVSDMAGHGIELPVDPNLNLNPDRYSCGMLRVEACDIRSNTGFGIRATMWSIKWMIERCYIVNNRLGGISTTGAGHEIKANSIAGNGQDGGTQAAGLHLAYETAGSPHNANVQSNEFDNNWGTHVWVEGYHHEVHQNRFIQSGKPSQTEDTYRNSQCVRLDVTSTSSATENAVDRNLFRFDAAAAGKKITAIAISAGASVANRCIDNLFAAVDEASHSQKPEDVGVTKYDVAPSGVRNLTTESGVQVAGSGPVSYGLGQIAVVKGAFTRLLKVAPTKLPFAEMIDSGACFANDVFTAPYPGFLEIQFNGVFKPIAKAAVGARVLVFRNGAQYHAQELPQGFSPLDKPAGCAFGIVLKVAKADAIELWASVDQDDTLYWVSSASATTTFKML